VIALIAAGGLFFKAETGRQLGAFAGEASREVRKVVWPTRRESLQVTAYVFAFVVVMAIFLWLADKTIGWIFYDLILRWR
jgi:preprotein translocase subunit SecE